ncbi:Ribonucleoprotein PTB-binding 2 [Homalodisca vitripennis]|nr:Ribonucleoprotein PTB-binding 2 [Homalodisca vitripennis]
MMATGSTEAAFSTTTQALPCFNSNLLKSDPNKYWNAPQVLATTSTEGFWEDDPEEKIKKKVLASKSQFHMGRSLQIKHLPRDVTEALGEEEDGTRTRRQVIDSLGSGFHHSCGISQEW